MTFAGFYIPRRLMLLLVSDAVALFLSISAGLAASYGGWPSLISDAYLIEKCTFVIVVLAVGFTMGLYRMDYMLERKWLSLRILVALTLAFVLLTILFYVVPETRIWMRALFPALLLSLLLLSLARGVFLRLAHVAALQRNILVLGTGEHAKTLEDLERRRRPSAFRIAGFVPLGVEPTLIAPDRIVRANNLLQQCEALGIGEIVVAATERRLALPTEDLLECRLCGIHVSNLSAFLERELGQVDVDGLNPSSLIFSNVAPGGPVERGMKRLFDVVLSIALLVISGPALLFTALAIKLYDGGPVFYRQERVGLYGRRISLLKFRSMRVDAEGDGKPRWAEKKDPRTTPVGRFIRQTRIDEIPQVFNVLAGEMSFVGPRPERPAIIDDLAREIPFYGYRHFVKPGITGWAQINYPYGASLADAKQKLKFDLFYVKNFGLLLDLVILIQTVRVVLWPQGVR